MVKAAFDVLEKVKPPGIDDLSWWRVVMTFSVLAIWLWIAWAMGVFGVPGLAKAGDVDHVLDKVTLLQIGEVEGKILATQKDWCITPPDSRARTFFLERRQMLLGQYFDLTGRPYQGLPSCSDLGL